MTYRANVQKILGALLEHVPLERIVVVSTPDYTRTPRGADFGQPDWDADAEVLEPAELGL